LESLEPYNLPDLLSSREAVLELMFTIEDCGAPVILLEAAACLSRGKNSFNKSKNKTPMR